MHNYDAQQHRAGQIISPLTLQTTVKPLSCGLLALIHFDFGSSLADYLSISATCDGRPVSWVSSPWELIAGKAHWHSVGSLRMYDRLSPCFVTVRPISPVHEGPMLPSQTSFFSFIVSRLRSEHITNVTSLSLRQVNKKIAPYGTDGRLFTTDVSAEFKVTWHIDKEKYQNSGPNKSRYYALV